MDALLTTFTTSYTTHNGHAIASLLDPAIPHSPIHAYARSSAPARLDNDLRSKLLYSSSLALTKAEARSWQEVFSAYWKFGQTYLATEPYAKSGGVAAIPASVEVNGQIPWDRIYEAWKDFVNAVVRGLQTGSFPVWTLPLLYVSGRCLRVFAIKADAAAGKSKGGPGAGVGVAFNAGFQDDVVGGLEQNGKLEDAARQINRIFALCISDRAPMEESRKWGLYYIAGLLFKTYFKLNSISLSKNILRSLQSVAGDMPTLNKFPKAHIVTFEYYVGIIHFLEEDYAKAETHLTHALSLCPPTSPTNTTRILTYLIPTRLLTTHTIPSSALLHPHSTLHRLFTPLLHSLRTANLSGFDAALDANYDAFVRLRIYLTLERARDVVVRNLFRKVYLAGGWEGEGERRVRRSRIPIGEFVAGMRLSMAGRVGGASTLTSTTSTTGPTEAAFTSEPTISAALSRRLESVDRDEVECALANMIYKGLVKGYISRERAMVVLSKAGAFPGTRT